ncbi:hypothetical protein CIB48_g9419 [Xylaria polymorpha]|nr:hypothetical protein CIB48_g9419 [Xylaria polymorpha]
MGIFLLLGGQTSNLVVYDTQSGSLNRLDNLNFYDMKTETWHWQLASGAIPPGRIAFCSVILQGPGDTSEIDAYVLSLPGFVWFKLSPSREFPRWGHSCAAAGGRSQIIVVGGQNAYSIAPESISDPDPWPQGIGVFDLQTLDWSDSYQPDSMNYQIPKVIDDWYRAGTDNDTSTRNSSTANAGASKTPIQMPSVAMIVGAALGGFLFLLLVAGILMFCWRRRTRRTDRSSSVSSPLKVLNVSTVRQIKKFKTLELPAETRPCELDSYNAPQELDSVEVKKHPNPQTS